MWVQDCQQNVCQLLLIAWLYTETIHVRPDIYGKIGNAEFQFVVWMMLKIIFWFRFGACHDFGMTINGPAPMLLGFSWMLQLINNVNCT
jgi:hypothetical protein